MGYNTESEAVEVPQPEPPVQPRNAQLDVKIVFWYNPRTDHILQGAPERFEPIYGYQKIVCNHALDAERWSKRLNEQDKRWQEMNNYEREMKEGAMRADIRREIKQRLANLVGTSRNVGLNKLFLEKALEELEKAEAKGQTVRESYLHAEAYEHGR
jgi:hypothetical protein